MALPKLSPNQPIVDNGRVRLPPSRQFLEFMEKARQAQETTDLDQSNLIAMLSAQQQQIQDALELAGLALETADAGGATKSGSSTQNHGISSASWVQVGLVSLTGVVAGTLTIPGTAPGQTVGTTGMSGGSETNAQYRIVEVVGGIDTVVFTGSFKFTNITTDEPQQIFQLDHYSQSDVAAFSAAASSTGAVDYRMDVRKMSGANMAGVRFYQFVRRAP